MKSITTLLIASLSCASLADTIQMRNGIEYEGEILSDKGDHYVVKIQVTKSIRDERKILKSEILDIIAEKKDETAFEKIKDLVPTPNLLSAADYDHRIAAVEAFSKKFSNSDLLKDADKILKVLDSERKQIAKGGIKFAGKVIRASERESRAYPLDASIAASKFRSLANANKTTGALRAWNNLESDFSSSTAYRETLPMAIKLMQAQLKFVDRSLASVDQQLMEREKGLERIPTRDRQRTKIAIAEDSAAYEARIAKEKKSGVKWLSLDPYHKEPLAETKRKLEQELPKLKRLDFSKLPNGDEAWNEAWKAVNGTADKSDATSAISAARSAGLPGRYIDILQARAPQK